MRLIDLDNDGKCEIAVSLTHFALYPCSFIVFKDNPENKLIKVQHPGWILDACAKDLNKDGKKELYLSGTNNFLQHEKSEEIGIAIEGDWDKYGEIILNKRDKREMAEKVNPFYKIVYVRFGFNPFIIKHSVWQFSILSCKMENTKDAISFYCDLISTNKLQSDKNYFQNINLREFSFSYMLEKCLCSFWNSAYFEKLNISIPSDKLKELLKTRYYNGKNWQEKFCYIERAKKKF
ncbi:hypothetical protein TTHT_1870 [Thermotomaculum hydrothermale]|uniref:VCBS repeat-containing protein n=1 Tax=Thermotomaculum hydrothermale TaxID=981385 RepID=A0A7R6PS36_9BACT|nr:hypothetical protein [Thermotomaculum hydrothermale]BBB33326.1 hypothetical protein TTHT_1870 [Thermotomaculum hydrothermale]